MLDIPFYIFLRYLFILKTYIRALQSVFYVSVFIVSVILSLCTVLWTMSLLSINDSLTESSELLIPFYGNYYFLFFKIFVLVIFPNSLFLIIALILYLFQDFEHSEKTFGNCYISVSSNIIFLICLVC